MHHTFSDPYSFLGFVGFPTMGQIIVNTLLGVAAFFLSFSLNSSQFKNAWFTTLRVILGAICISSLGTVISSVSVGWIPGNPNDFLFLCSLGALSIWIIVYYTVHFASLPKEKRRTLINILNPPKNEE